LSAAVKYPQLRSSKGAAVGRDDGTVEGHKKGPAKGPNAIRRDNEELGRDVGSIKVWDDGAIEGQYDRSSLKNQ